MTIETWLAFLAASAVVVLIPGPTVTLVVGYALARGRGAALATALGVALGDLTAMTLSLLGLGAVLAASATLFTVVKVVGALYLAYMGWKLWTAPVASEGAPMPAEPDKPAWRMLAHAFAVTALNPKGLVFFVAFVPQFVTPGVPYAPQVAILVATFVTLGFLNAIAYALAASRARGLLRRPAVMRAVNRTGGALLVGAGVAALAGGRA